MTALLDRCFANRRDDIGDIIRTILSGSMPVPIAIEGAPPALNTWIGEGCNRHAALVETLPEDDPRRFPLGSFIFAYELRGTLRTVSNAELLEILSTRMPRHTGWPPWWVPTRQGIAPYLKDDAVECWLGGDENMLSGVSMRDAAHSDFWRVSPKGLAFLMRGYQEDGPEVQARGFEPGKAMDATVPVWRVGEALLHAEALASALGDGPAQSNWFSERIIPGCLAVLLSAYRAIASSSTAPICRAVITWC